MTIRADAHRMNAMETLTAVLGWCALINLLVLAASSLAIVGCRKWIGGIHARMFGMDEAALSAAYFRYLATYKLLVLVFNLVPYVALRIVSAG